MSEARNLLIDHWMGHENRDMGTRYAKQLIDRDAAAAILDRWPVEGQGSSLQTRCLTFQTATLLRCQRGNREVNCNGRSLFVSVGKRMRDVFPAVNCVMGVVALRGF